LNGKRQNPSGLINLIAWIQCSILYMLSEAEAGSVEVQPSQGIAKSFSVDAVKWGEKTFISFYPSIYLFSSNHNLTTNIQQMLEGNASKKPRGFGGRATNQKKYRKF
jgi:hypothetical protein